jgi:hypothetical protein
LRKIFPSFPRKRGAVGEIFRKCNLCRTGGKRSQIVLCIHQPAYHPFRGKQRVQGFMGGCICRLTPEPVAEWTHGGWRGARFGEQIERVAAPASAARLPTFEVAGVSSITAATSTLHN